MTEVHKVDAFPVPLFIMNLAEVMGTLNDDLVRDIENDPSVQQRTGVGVTQTEAGLEQRHHSFGQLKDVISDASTQLLGREVHAEHFWANSTEDGFHMPHAHRIGNYMWNGVYFPYGDTDWIYESSSTPRPGSLVLLDPLEFVKAGVADEHTDRYPYWGNPICVAPKAGTLALFPVYLPHMVTPADGPRRSIAFYLRT
jgi:hypothetical protein